MYCKHCGNKMDEDALFCTSCGCRKDAEEKALYCEKCGTKISDGTLFCATCGNQLINDQNTTVRKQEHQINTPQPTIRQNKASTGFLHRLFHQSDKKKKTSVLTSVTTLIVLDFVKTYFTYKANTVYYDNDISFVYFIIRTVVTVLMGILVIHAIKKGNRTYLQPAVVGSVILALQVLFGIFTLICTFYRNIGYSIVVYYGCFIPGGLLVDNFIGLLNLESNPWQFSADYLKQFGIIIKLACWYSLSIVIFFLQESIFSIKRIIINKKNNRNKINT